MATGDRRAYAARIGAELGCAVALQNDPAGVRYGDGRPFLFAERALTPLEQLASDAPPRPGIWWQDGEDGEGSYLGGNGNTLAQLATDAMIVSELYKHATHADVPLLEALGGPRIVIRGQHCNRERRAINMRQQRAGQHSDPLMRIAMVRAVGERDLAWWLKCEDPTCELPILHAGDHQLTYWRHVGQSPRRYNAPRLFKDGLDDWMEGFVKEYSGHAHDSSFVRALFSPLAYRTSGAKINANSNRIRAELLYQDEHELEPRVLHPREIDVARGDMTAEQWGKDRDARGVCWVCKARPSCWCDTVEHTQFDARQAQYHQDAVAATLRDVAVSDLGPQVHATLPPRASAATIASLVDSDGSQLDVVGVLATPDE